MPLLRKPILIPCEGIDYSKPSTFINDRAGFPKNMEYYRMEMRKRCGKAKYGSVAISGGQVMSYGILELRNGSKYLLRTSKTKFEKYNTATGAWDSISLTDFTGGDEDFHFFANVPESDIIIETNFVDLPRKWTGAGNNTSLGGGPPRAKYICYLSPYVLLGYTYDGVTTDSSKVQWSGTNTPEVWIGGNSGALICSDEPSPIRNVVKLNEFAAVYKEDSLWLLNKVLTADIFESRCIKTGMGLLSSRAVTDWNGQHYFMSQNDFIVWNGIHTESFGASVRDEVFSKVNREKAARSFALHIHNLNEIWFFIVISGETWPTEIWKYNYRTGFWYYDSCANLTTAITWQKTATETWDDQTLTWDTSILRWDDNVTTQSWEEIILGNSSGYSYKLDYSTTNDDGTAVESWLQTPDFLADKVEYKKRWLQLDVWARGPAKLYVDYSTDYGDTWTNIPYDSSQSYIQLTSVYTMTRMYFDIVSDKIRFRFRNAESAEMFYIRNYYPYYLSREEEGR